MWTPPRLYLVPSTGYITTPLHAVVRSKRTLPARARIRQRWLLPFFKPLPPGARCSDGAREVTGGDPSSARTAVSPRQFKKKLFVVRPLFFLSSRRQTAKSRYHFCFRRNKTLFCIWENETQPNATLRKFHHSGNSTFTIHNSTFRDSGRRSYGSGQSMVQGHLIELSSHAIQRQPRTQSPDRPLPWSHTAGIGQRPRPPNSSPPTRGLL